MWNAMKYLNCFHMKCLLTETRWSDSHFSLQTELQERRGGVFRHLSQGLASPPPWLDLTETVREPLSLSTETVLSWSLAPGSRCPLSWQRSQSHELSGISSPPGRAKRGRWRSAWRPGWEGWRRWERRGRWDGSDGSGCRLVVKPRSHPKH